MGYLKEAQKEKIAAQKAHFTDLKKGSAGIEDMPPVEKYKALAALEQKYSELGKEAQATVLLRSELIVDRTMTSVWGLGVAVTGIAGCIWGGAVLGVVGVMAGAAVGIGVAPVVGRMLAWPFEAIARKKDTRENEPFISGIAKELKAVDAAIARHIEEFPEALMANKVGISLFEKGGPRGTLIRQSFQKTVADNAAVTEDMGGTLKEVAVDKPDIASRFAESLNKARGQSVLKKIANF